MDVKGEVLLQLFNKSKLRNGTKTFIEPKFFSIYSQLGFSAPLNIRIYTCNKLWDGYQNGQVQKQLCVKLTVLKGY